MDHEMDIFTRDMQGLDLDLRVSLLAGMKEWKKNMETLSCN